MHMTLNYNLGMSERMGDRLLVKVISLLLVFTVLFASAADARRFILEEVSHGLEAADDWAFAKVTNYKKETWDQRLGRLMNTNIETAGGIGAAVTDKNVRCLAENVYHESRGESIEGQKAVAWVTLNRVVSKQYPDSICEVVHQGKKDKNGEPIRNKCQFSWTCDGKSDSIKNIEEWNTALRVARDVLIAYDHETDPTGGSIMYHNEKIKPYWISAYERETEIDNHIFYTNKG